MRLVEHTGLFSSTININSTGFISIININIS